MRSSNPFRCALKSVPVFLVNLFEQGYRYRSVCGHRSADEKLIGQQKKVSSLINGIFHLKPPQPRHAFISKTQIVRLFKKYSPLLSKTSASSVGDLQNLGIKVMTRTENKYYFHFN